jgi:hypothetical protein
MSWLARTARLQARAVARKEVLAEKEAAAKKDALP